MAKTKYPKKYSKQKMDSPVVETTTEKEPETNNEQQTTTMENNTEITEESAGSPQGKQNIQPTLEESFDVTANPHAAPKIHRDYNTEGMKPAEKTEGAKPAAEATDKEQGHKQFRDSMKPEGDASAAPPAGETGGDEFTPTPPEPEPDPDAAPEQEIKDGPPPGPDGDPFKIPSGTAEELIDDGAKMLNYLISEYGDMVVGMKIHKEYHQLTTAVPRIKEQNRISCEKLKFKPEEVAMLKKPLVKIMQEKGMRGLTPGEELVVALIIVGAAKTKVIIEIRRENKITEEIILAEIRSIKNQMAGKTATKEEPEIELTPVEEVN